MDKLKKRRKNHCPVSDHGSFTLPETDPGSDSCPSEKQEVGIRVQVCAMSNVLHSIMWPSGLESESESITESVSVNVNEPLQ